jgi:uncharacterized protein YukJ
MCHGECELQFLYNISLPTVYHLLILQYGVSLTNPGKQRYYYIMTGCATTNIYSILQTIEDIILKVINIENVYESLPTDSMNNLYNTVNMNFVSPMTTSVSPMRM